ncbi:hypothetical protein GCM10025783_03090 [Amnibacterium soli]|uniref:Bacterial Ig-like domain-containing protein n=1 Tax=Amnibacterium soli TaxID=1282736 RepID=A0ABP8YSI2_9MICO
MPGTPRAARRRRSASLAAAAVGVVALLCGALVLPASAANMRSDLLDETFTGATTAKPQWALPSTGGRNDACLTAGTSTATAPIKGCALSTADAAGQGVLRLTGSGTYLAGSVFSTAGVPLAQGLDITFDSYQYNGSGADGISFVLAATDPTAPAAPATGGAVGEGLGYATANGVRGVANGYLGLGVDVYGNFAQTGSNTANGCGQNSTPPRTPNAITVRGPGDGTSGYCVLGSPLVVSGKLDKQGATARPAPVPVEVAINPSSSPATTRGGQQVPARSWFISVTPYSNGTTGDTALAAVQTRTGPLPSAAGSAPAAWLDSTGVPYVATFGWAGSTGGSTETHEIAGYRATSLTGPVPVYSLTATDDQQGQLALGASGSVVVTPHLGADDGQEPAGVPVTVRTAFSSGITPPTGSFTANGYACTTSGATATCTITPAAAVPPGGDLPAVVIPVTGATAGPATVTATVSSRDGRPASATTALTVTRMTAQSYDIGYGTDETLSVAGISGAATGTVAFTDAAGPLCTATLPARSCVAARPSAGAHAVTATWQPASGPAITATTSFQVARATATGLAMTAAPGSTPWGTGALLTGTGFDPTATGTIAFQTSAGAALCTATLPATSCTASSTVDVGAVAVEGRYSGDANHDAALLRASYTVVQRTAAITASASSASTAFGTPVVLSVGGLPLRGATAATGTVTYRSGDGALLCTATLPATDCTTPASLTIGARTVVATYSGDAHDTAAQSAPIPLAVTRLPVTLAAGPDGASVAHGARIALTATGLPVGATGTVSFTDQRGRALCGFDVAQASSCAAPADLEVGTETIVAAYSGGGLLAPATSASFAVRVVQGAAPALAAHVAAARIPSGTAQVLSVSGLPADATGGVAFADARGPLCSVPDVTAAASCTTARDLTVGQRAVTATYSGDASYPSATATTAFQVVKAPTAVTASAPGGTSAFGTARQLVAGGLPADATGTVRFVDQHGDLLCTVRLEDGRACMTARALPADAYRLAATYSGDDRYLDSSDSAAFTIAAADTAITAGALATTVSTGVKPVLTVAGLDLRGDDAATGTVAFRLRSGALLCTVVLPDTACTSTAALPAGSADVVARYSGDANHGASTGAVRLTVLRDAVTLSVRAAVAAVEPGATVVLTVAGLPDAATGTVRIRREDDAVCTITLPGDRCAVAHVRWPLGTAKLTAQYSGDDAHLTASARTTVRVQQPAREAQTVTATTGADGRLTVSVQAPVGAAGSIQVLERPAHGSVTLQQGAFRYRADGSATQADRFTYRLVRPDGSSKIVTVTIRGGRLAETGSAVVGPLGVGGALLGAGVLLLVLLAATRRRRGARS